MGSGSLKMNQEFENSKEFLTNLDRILAGEQAVISDSAGSDLTGALDFAQKMKALRAVPSAEFKAQLKAKLLQQIAQQEEAARMKKARGWWANFTANQLVWQAITAVLVIGVITGLLWATNFMRLPGSMPSSTTIVSATTTRTTTTAIASVTATYTTTNVTTSATNPGTYTTAAPRGPLVVNANTDKTTYPAGASVKINVSLTNVTSSAIVIPAYPPILSLMQGSQPVYTFAGGPAAKTIAPYTTVNFTLTWNQQDAKGAAAAPGYYYLELEDINTGGQTIKLDLSTPVYFNILPLTTPSLITDKNITVNQTVTDSNISITLNSLSVLNNGTINVTATILSAQGPGSSATAYYSIDNGWLQSTTASSVNGSQYTWMFPATVTADNTELVFIITGIGTKPGYWEFRIPLK
jgi:hypothetical protein